MKRWLERELDKINHKLDTILRLDGSIIRGWMQMAGELDALVQKVNDVATVEAGATAAIAGISLKLTALETELAAAGFDTAKLVELTNQLDAATAPLAAAIANVPA